MAISKKKLGALWRREQKNGTEYLSGNIELPSGTVMPIVAFLNGYKNENERAPDFIIYLSESEESVRLAQRDPERVKKERAEMGDVRLPDPDQRIQSASAEKMPIELPDDPEEGINTESDVLDLSQGLPEDEKEIDVSSIPF